MLYMPVTIVLEQPARYYNLAGRLAVAREPTQNENCFKESLTGRHRKGESLSGCTRKIITTTIERMGSNLSHSGASSSDIPLWATRFFGVLWRLSQLKAMLEKHLDVHGCSISIQITNRTFTTPALAILNGKFLLNMLVIINFVLSYASVSWSLSYTRGNTTANNRRDSRPNRRVGRVLE
jgi:hypothetical protein